MWKNSSQLSNLSALILNNSAHLVNVSVQSLTGIHGYYPGITFSVWISLQVLQIAVSYGYSYTNSGSASRSYVLEWNSAMHGWHTTAEEQFTAVHRAQRAQRVEQLWIKFTITTWKNLLSCHILGWCWIAVNWCGWTSQGSIHIFPLAHLRSRIGQNHPTIAHNCWKIAHSNSLLLNVNTDMPSYPFTKEYSLIKECYSRSKYRKTGRIFPSTTSTGF